MAEPLVALPVRSFRDAYRRLATHYRPQRRSELAQTLATRTASVIVAAGRVPYIVTSSAEVRRWARDAGYEIINDSPPAGLDGAAHRAVSYAGGRPWLILHADLPFLTTSEVRGVLDLLRTGERIAAPSYDGGTSALGGSGTFPFSYGVASYRRHLVAATRVRTIISVGFLFDIDRPKDLQVAGQHAGGSYLSAWQNPDY